MSHKQAWKHDLFHPLHTTECERWTDRTSCLIYCPVGHTEHGKEWPVMTDQRGSSPALIFTTLTSDGKTASRQKRSPWAYNEVSQNVKVVWVRVFPSFIVPDHSLLMVHLNPEAPLRPDRVLTRFWPPNHWVESSSVCLHPAPGS